jgi:uncharacterized NAD(P)/FAD-binding protein YdhS
VSTQADIFDVAIIGGGFSGLMVLHHLVKTGSSGDAFAIIEPEAQLGCGAAYSTTNPRHLLNVPAGKMSALPVQPDHFIKWLGSDAGHRALKAIGIDRVWQAGDYAPRRLYAHYLKDIAQETFQEAKAKGVRLSHLRQKAVDIEQSAFYKLELDNGQVPQSKAIVLATGNLSPADTNKTPEFISDPWRYDYAASAQESGPIGIMGTGLTMIDTVLSLREFGFTGKILVASRRGLLPEVHNDTPAVLYNAPLSLPAHAPEKLGPLMRALRSEIKSCLSKQITWQHVFDRWRPHTVAIWAKLDTADRSRFFDQLFTLWNVHRHRMAPEIGAFISKELATGRMKILKGSVKVTSKLVGLGLVVDGKQYDVKKVFDCRGVCLDISRSGNGLISTLYRKGLILRHETGRGIQATSDLQVLPSGRDGSFLAIGTPLIGEYLETTAVPELRQQAQKVAVALGDFIRSGKVKNTA